MENSDVVRFVDCLNCNNDGRGTPTLGFFVQWGTINDSGRLEFSLPRMKRPILCHVQEDVDNKNTKIYRLSYQNGRFSLVDGRAAKFVENFARHYKATVSSANPWKYFSAEKGTENLHFIFTTLESRINKSISDTLLNIHHVWEVHHYFHFHTKRYIYACKSNVNRDTLVRSTMDSKIELLLHADFVHIKYQKETDDDKLKLDSGLNDICSGVGIWPTPNSGEVQGTICLFMHDSKDSNNHYALTACHVFRDLCNLDEEYVISHKFGEVSAVHLSKKTPIDLSPLDAVACHINGSPICRFPNLNCCALPDEDSGPSSDEETTQVQTRGENELPGNLEETVEDNDILTDDDANDIDSNDHADPSYVKYVGIELLKEGQNNRELPIYKYGARTDLTVGFIGRIGVGILLDGKHYQNLIEVKWLCEIDFAWPGDSGSLYYLYHNQHFIPIAMHVGSKAKLRQSYGILLYEIFDALKQKHLNFALCSSKTHTSV